MFYKKACFCTLQIHFASHAKLAITAHWIDARFKLHEALLAFDHITGSHTGYQLASVVFAVVEKFDLCNKLFCITADNASNNDKMFESMASLLQANYAVDWDPKAMHVRCMNHTINLAVQAFLGKLKVIKAKPTAHDTAIDEEPNEDTGDVEDWDGDSDEASKLFTQTLHKLRSIAKVCYFVADKSLSTSCFASFCTLQNANDAGNRGKQQTSRIFQSLLY